MSSTSHFEWPHVGICGAAGAGKDALATEMIAQLGYVRIGLADALKEMVGGMALGNVSPGDIYRWVEERKHTESVRTTLQGFGHLMREHVDPEFWVKKVLARQAAQPPLARSPIVSPDVRYFNETLAFGQHGWLIVKVIRPNHTSPLTPDQQQHVSEAELADYTPNITIINDGTPADMLDSFMSQAMPIMLQRILP